MVYCICFRLGEIRAKRTCKHRFGSEDKYMNHRIAEAAMSIGNVRLEVFIVEFLDLVIELFVVTSIFGGSEHHGQNSAGLKKRQDLRIRDLLEDPLDRGRRIDQVVFLFSDSSSFTRSASRRRMFPSSTWWIVPTVSTRPSFTKIALRSSMAQTG